NAVDWAAVDGVPKVDPTKNRKGFRGGVTDPGDDVGMYTTMALDSQDNPIVAYFDRTNGALRVARYDGTAWSTYELDRPSKGWAGKFNSMINAGGKLALAYQSIEPGTKGFAKAKVRAARATSDAPASAGDWALEDAVVDDSTPCIQATCG